MTWNRAILCAIQMAALVGIARFCHFQTHGFRVAKLEHLPPPSHATALPPAPSAIQSLLQQRFTYLGRGLQSFAFVSEDGLSVLKLCTARCKPKTFISYLIAYEELKDQSALLYLHLDQSELLGQTLHIVDALGICHSLPADQLLFLVQQKAELAYPRLNYLMAQGQVEQAKKALHALLQLIASKFHKGIADSDPLIRTNFGFIGDRPVQIDVGSLSKNPRVQDPAFFRIEFARITASLKSWLAQHHPSLLPELEQEVQAYVGT